MSLRISAVMLVRDSAATVERAILSVRPSVDEVAVLDTGSVDDTLAIVKRLATAPGAPIRLHEWAWRDDYGAAYQVASDAASYDWIFCLDSDEVLVLSAASVVGRLVAQADEMGIEHVITLIDAADTLNPKNPIIWWHNRLHRRHAGKWEGVTHEIFRPDYSRGEQSLLTANYEQLYIRHLKRKSREVGNYDLILLERAAALSNMPPRTLFYLGCELALHGRHVEAAYAFERYVSEGHDQAEDEVNFWAMEALGHAARLHRYTCNYPRADRLEMECYASYKQAIRARRPHREARRLFCEIGSRFKLSAEPTSASPWVLQQDAPFVMDSRLFWAGMYT